jgi:hypothetical protein
MKGSVIFKGFICINKISIFNDKNEIIFSIFAKHRYSTKGAIKVS